MRRAVFFTCLAVSFVVVGCGPPSLEGKWIAADTARETITFTGKQFKLEGSLPNGDVLTVNGDYTYEHNQISLLAKSIAIRAGQSKLQPQVDKTLAENQQKLLQNFDAKNPRNVIWWKKNEEVEFKSPDGKNDTMYDRVKT